MCDYCADLHPTVRIKTPQKLSKMLLRAADRLADGTLADITLAYAKVRRISPDYHGNGGEWKMMEVASKRFPAT